MKYNRLRTIFWIRSFLGLCPTTSFSLTFDSRSAAAVGRNWFSISDAIFLCDWFRTDESKEENCCRSKWGGECCKITIKQK